MLPTVQATRYVTPLREGGSLPAIVEASDLGLYVLKFRGAGQGPLALVAEVIAGELGRALGLKIPHLALMEVDTALGRNEPDAEIRQLLRDSVGLNLGVDFLPGAVTFDPAAGDVVAADLASAVVWFDAFVTNVDRTPRNPNLLLWHKTLYLIDHGAALYFHHAWRDVETMARSPFAVVRDHILLPWASDLAGADQLLRRSLTPELLRRVIDEVPDEWLGGDQGPPSPAAKREGYLAFLEQRLASSAIFVEEAVRARAKLV
jgi:HipA-like protein